MDGFILVCRVVPVVHEIAPEVSEVIVVYFINRP